MERIIFNHQPTIADRVSQANEEIAEALYHPAFKLLPKEKQEIIQKLSELLVSACDEI